MDNVEQATAPTTFNVMSFIQDTAYPTGTVKVYTDITAAKEILRLNKERQALEAQDMDEAEKITPKIEEMTARAEASALTFNLRGFPPAIVSEIMDAHNTEENDSAADPHLIAKAIVSVENAEGGVDDHMWTAEEVTAFRGYIAEGQWLVLLGGVADVLFNATVFDKTVDAGFLGGRPDVAA